jgi:hypothetical protein
MSPRSLVLPRSIFGSLTLVAVLIAGAVGLAFYSHVADTHSRAKNTPSARIAAWKPPAGLTDVTNPTGCTSTALSRCLTSTKSAHEAAATVATSLGVTPAAVTCRVLRAAFYDCSFDASLGSTTLVVVVTDQGFFAPVVTVPAKPAAGSDAVGSLVEVGVPGVS